MALDHYFADFGGLGWSSTGTYGDLIGFKVAPTRENQKERRWTMDWKLGHRVIHRDQD